MKPSPITYYPDTDTLSISISPNPATGGGENAGVEGADQDIIFSYDDTDRLVNITIEHASKRADLSHIQSNTQIHKGKGVGIYTMTEGAKQLNVSRHTIHAILKKMKQAGLQVGTQAHPNASIVLTSEDLDAIKKWRAQHPNGRPAISKAK